jgi:hypothetical protein
MGMSFSDKNSAFEWLEKAYRETGLKRKQLLEVCRAGLYRFGPGAIVGAIRQPTGARFV